MNIETAFIIHLWIIASLYVLGTVLIFNIVYSNENRNGNNLQLLIYSLLWPGVALFVAILNIIIGVVVGLQWLRKTS